MVLLIEKATLFYEMVLSIKTSVNRAFYTKNKHASVDGAYKTKKKTFLSLLTKL